MDEQRDQWRQVMEDVFMTRVYSTNGFDQPIFHIIDDI